MSLKKGIDLLVAHANRHKPRARSIAPQAETPSRDRREISFALNYLDAFGYLEKTLPGWKDIELGDIVDAIKKFQGMFGIRQDGNLCAKVIKAMEQPRCGHPDIIRPHNAQYLKVRDFAEAKLPAWRKRSLKYAITDFLPGWEPANQSAIVANAFSAWTRHGDIECVLTTQGDADIIISVGEGRRSNFDGPGGVLAWAFLPDGSDQQLTMKFDLAETWVTGPSQRGIILFNVACHEFGHLFGLDHSRIESALMAPFYNPAVAVPQANDDIPRFTSRYGIKPAVPPPGTPVPPPSPGPGGGGSVIIEPINVTVELGNKARYKGRVLLDPSSVTN